jgi:hypothetical protein
MTAMFEIDRIFSSRNPDTGMVEWFFSAREGIYGTYSSKEQATKGLQEFIQFCIKEGDDGGRTKPEADRLSLMPRECGADVVHEFNPLKKKKGTESL